MLFPPKIACHLTTLAPPLSLCHFARGRSRGRCHLPSETEPQSLPLLSETELRHCDQSWGRILCRYCFPREWSRGQCRFSSRDGAADSADSLGSGAASPAASILELEGKRYIESLLRRRCLNARAQKDWRGCVCCYLPADWGGRMRLQCCDQTLAHIMWWQKYLRCV